MIITITMNPAVDKTVIIDDFRIGALNRVSSIRLDAGGKGINVSKTIKALNGSSHATGILAGKSGEYIKHCLDRMQVDNDFIFVSGETRTNLKIYDRLSHAITEINEPGLLEAAEEDLKLLEKKVIAGVGRDDILVLSGSIPAGLSVDIYKHWIEKVKQSGTRVFLDADGELLSEGIKARPYLVKPNLTELEGLLGKKPVGLDEIVSAGKELLERGIEVAVISLGIEGAVFVKNGIAVHAAGPTAAGSTVGAGDAMVGALAHAFSSGYTFEKAVILAVAAATAKAAGYGTEPPAFEAVLRYAEQVQLNYQVY